METGTIKKSSHYLVRDMDAARDVQTFRTIDLARAFMEREYPAGESGSVALIKVTEKITITRKFV